MQLLIIIVEDSKTLFCPSKFPWARGRIYSKFVDNLGTRPQKGSPALRQGLLHLGGGGYIYICMYVCMYVCIYIYIYKEQQLFIQVSLVTHMHVTY